MVTADESGRSPHSLIDFYDEIHCGEINDTNVAQTIHRDDLLREAQIDDNFLFDLEKNSVIAADEHGNYHRAAIEIVSAVAELSSFGIFPQHLQVFRVAVDRETDLIRQATGPLRHQKERTSAAHADQTERKLINSCVRMHAALLRGNQ